MSFGMTFGSVEAVLAGSHQIASEKRTAFQARLKNFMRLGIFDGAKTGRGRAAEFQAGQIVLFALALEFGQLGVGPERAVHLLNANAAGIAATIAASAKSEGGNDWSFTPAFVYFDPNSMGDLAGNSFVRLDFATDANFAQSISWTVEEFNRVAAISLSGVIGNLAAHIASSTTTARSEFRAAVVDWAMNHDQHS